MSVTYITVDSEYAGQRIDNFLMRHCRRLPKARLYRALRHGECRVNKKRVKPVYRVQGGDYIRIPPFELPETQRVLITQSKQEVLADCILFEDKKLIVLNKPAGMPVHGGSGLEGGVINILPLIRPESPFLSLAHRLDKLTSGCLLIAKRRSALRTLQTLWMDGQVEKTYLLLVKGQWQGGKRVVQCPLLKKTLGAGRRLVVVDSTGKMAKTMFTPLKIYAQYSLLQARLLTGRTHQIRVQASHIGYPIVGDPLYGDHRWNTTIAKTLGSRMYLHAASLELPERNGVGPLALSACLDAAWRLEG